MTLVLIGASAALAAAPMVRVGGLGAPRTVAVVAQREAEVAVIRCNDAGVAPDAGPDAVWSCGPLPPAAGTVRLGVLRDGRLLDAGSADLDGADVFVVVEGGAARVGQKTSPPELGVPANSGGATLLARVTGLGDGSAPVIRLQSAAGGSELMCRDDGVFPDDIRNDGNHGCAGPAPGTGAEVFINGKDGATRSFGKVEWDLSGAVAWLVVDGAAGTSRVESFPIVPFPAVDPEAGKPPPDPTPVAPPTPAPPAPVAEPPPPGGGTGPQPVQSPERSPVATRDVLPTGAASPTALVAAFLLGAGGALYVRRRTERLPSLLQRHPAPPLLPGGPTLADGAVALRAADPAALAAALLPALARHRRVVLVAPADLVLPPVADGPVYRAAAGDCEEIEAAVRALARAPGPPVAVLVVGEASVSDPGAVAPDALRKLREGLGARAWLAVVHEGPAPAGYAAWVAEGPPWSLARATLAS